MLDLPDQIGHLRPDRCQADYREKVPCQCSCGRVETFVAQALHRALRLQRPIRCSRCRWGQSLLPGVGDAQAETLIAIVAGWSVGLAPTPVEVARTIRKEREVTDRLVRRLTEKRLVCRTFERGRYRPTAAGLELVGEVSSMAEAAE